jgi:alpha-amylase
MGDTYDVNTVALVHEWFKLDIRLSFDRPAALWRLPIETISNSEGGFERTYQCSCLLPHWTVRLAPGESWQLNMRITLRELEA